MGIRGSKLYMLWSDCSDKNMGKFFRTLMMLRGVFFTEEQIHGNLDLIRAIPFIDENVNPERTPVYGEEFGPTQKDWKQYCMIQKEAFVPRLEQKMNVEAQYKKSRK